jgi:hypothetical protein
MELEIEGEQLSHASTAYEVVYGHLIEKVPKFKAYVDEYLCSGDDALEGHTNV